MSGSLRVVVGFKCSRCVEGTGREETMEMEVEHVGKLECISKFCYLGDMIGSSGGAEEASVMLVLGLGLGLKAKKIGPWP